MIYTLQRNAETGAIETVPLRCAECERLGIEEVGECSSTTPSY